MGELRELRTILFSDIVGYSRRMGENETLALEVLERHNGIVVPIVQGHGGEVLKFIGDAVLASFKSAAAAVKAALEIQAALGGYNREKPENEKIQIRIGIHAGDVVLKDGDVFGDGVNVASRIEGLAPSGGICISQTVYDMVHAQSQFKTQSLGPRRLKNIKEAVGIHRVLTGEESSLSAAGPRLRKTGRIALVAALILLGAAGGLRLLKNRQAGPQNFVIAVAPFSASTDRGREESDAMRGLIASGIDKLIQGHKKVEVLTGPEIPSPHSFAEAKNIAQDLGARILIWGEVFQVGPDIEIEPRMTLASPIWRDEHHTADVLHANINQPKQFTLRRQEARGVRDLAVIAYGAYQAENGNLERAVSVFDGIRPQTADSLLAKGIAYYHAREYDRALETMKETLKLTPRCADAWTYRGRIGYKKGLYRHAREAYRRARELDPEIAWAYIGEAFLDILAYKFKAAEEKAKRAVELDPRSPWAHVALARARLGVGDIEGAHRGHQAAFEFATDPYSEYWAHHSMARLLTKIGDFSPSIEHWDRAIEIDPSREEAYLFRAMALFFSGEKRRARRSLENWRRKGVSPWSHFLATLMLGETSLEELPKGEEGLKIRGLYYIGMLKRLAGENGESREAFRQAVELEKEAHLHAHYFEVEHAVWEYFRLTHEKVFKS